MFVILHSIRPGESEWNRDFLDLHALPSAGDHIAVRNKPTLFKVLCTVHHPYDYLQDLEFAAEVFSVETPLDLERLKSSPKSLVGSSEM